MICLLFLLSGLACALAGLILTSMLGSASPTASTGLELSVVTAIILGGTTLSGGEGTAFGTLVGLLIVGFLNNGLIIQGVDPFWQYVAQGALLIGAVSVDRLRERLERGQRDVSRGYEQGSGHGRLFDVVIVGAGSAGCALARRLTDDPSGDRGTGRGGWEPLPSVHRRADRVLQALGNARSTGTTSRYRKRARPIAATACHAVGSSAAPARSTAWSTCAGHTRTSTGGSRPVAWAGAGTTCAGPTSNSKNSCSRAVPEEHNELSQVFIDAAQEAGFRFNPFFDDGDLEGCGWNRLSIHQGQRQSSYRAFVEPVLDRPNLHLITDADRPIEWRSRQDGAVTGLERPRSGWA